MYNATEQFFDALKNGAVQHIRGRLTDITGIEYALNDSNLIGSPRYDKQCVSDPDTFSFGELYIGSAELTIRMAGAQTNRFRGGEVALDFGVSVTDTEIEWIPLGVWDVTEPKREAVDRIVLQCSDKLHRLQVKTNNAAVGLIPMQNVLDFVAEKCGVEFAQTAQEIKEMAHLDGSAVSLYRTSFAENCWDEVRQIAQLIGGFAFSNREGKIEFRCFQRGFGDDYDMAYDIGANQRFSVSLAEYEFGVGAITYTDKQGTSYTTERSKREAWSDISFGENGYIWKLADDESEIMKNRIDRIHTNLDTDWTPGTLDFYGNPCIDLGDMVRVYGGINGDADVSYFLVCTDSWQFRAPQTLISPGPAKGMPTTASGGSSGSSVASVTQNVVSKVNKAITFEVFEGAVYGAERNVAIGGFSCKADTDCIVGFNGIFSAESDCTALVRCYVDGVAQDFGAQFSMSSDSFQTVSFTAPLYAAAGTHTVQITAVGEGEIGGIKAFVFGQELTEKIAEFTSGEDYTYTISGGLATVTGYIGTNLYPEIPSMLGGARTYAIGSTAFTESKITGCYIPDGVTEIM